MKIGLNQGFFTQNTYMYQTPVILLSYKLFLYCFK